MYTEQQTLRCKVSKQNTPVQARAILLLVLEHQPPSSYNTHASKQNNDEVTTAVYNVRSGVSTTAGRGGGRALYTLVSNNTQRMYIVSQSSAQVHCSCGSPSLTTDSTHHTT